MAAVAFVGLAGCGNRPNNLETYYDDPAPVSDTPSAAAAPVPRPQTAPSAPVKPRPDPRAVAVAVAAVAGALLSDEDVAEEGVHPGAGKVLGCLTGLAAGERRSASWMYPSGSVLDHQVTAYPDRSGADVVSGAECAGTALSLPAQEGVTGLRAWCEGSTCTVLVAKGNLVSALSVAASTPTRAADAAKRLLPKLVAKLVTQP